MHDANAAGQAGSPMIALPPDNDAHVATLMPNGDRAT